MFQTAFVCCMMGKTAGRIGYCSFYSGLTKIRTRRRSRRQYK
ncbi:glycosyl transferase family 1 [Neisseria meningitidis]|nr:glycosyl transferase family 1 [Neisseria meningitidis]MBG8583255.1 glycosyl transferase family 1 [Neisseria meningitidis]MBG8596643.1 glycosyl transferase family 1 [Neisseria meningitidis]MBJ7757921.1 glycosyl transferase family 1 [Neisseria meningitidis]MBJ7799992.1 glycosyl transferase family 1 [Neisseria meningitidis]